MSEMKGEQIMATGKTRNKATPRGNIAQNSVPAGAVVIRRQEYARLQKWIGQAAEMHKLVQGLQTGGNVQQGRQAKQRGAGAPQGT